MSRLQKLIQKLCPDGVEYVTLDECAFYPRERVNIDDLDEEAYVSVENLAQDFGGLTGEVATTKPGTAVIRFREGDVLVGNIRPYLKKVWLADFNGGTNGDVLVFRIKDSYVDRLLPEFVYMQLASENFIDFDMKYAKGAKMPRGDKKAVLRYRIPVPPLEVQREIVRVLDEYTAAHDELVRKLEEEMELRGQQLSIARNEMCMKEEWPLEAVGDVFTTITGGTPKKSNTDYYGDNHPFYKPGDLVHGTVVSSAEDGLTDEGLASTRSVPPSSILMTCIGSIGKAAMVSVLGSCNQQINAVLPRDGVNMSFYLHVLCSDYFQKQVMTSGSFGNMPILSRGKFDKLLVPVPPLDVQDKVASVLDGLSGAINESLSLLREELSIQEQSLSGVRNELLSFPEKVA